MLIKLILNLKNVGKNTKIEMGNGKLENMRSSHSSFPLILAFFFLFLFLVRKKLGIEFLRQKLVVEHEAPP